MGSAVEGEVVLLKLLVLFIKDKVLIGTYCLCPLKLFHSMTDALKIAGIHSSAQKV
jgi:hypothetical protein